MKTWGNSSGKRKERGLSDAVVGVIQNDPLCLSKLVFLREFTRKMLVHIEWFESTEARAHEVYRRLVAIQQSFTPLFDANEVETMLTLGRCPEDNKPAMRSLIEIASNAARNDWTVKMDRNQDDETILFFQMIAVFDPLQKAAFAFADADLLQMMRPVHDSIFTREPNYDPLAVLFPIYGSHSPLLLMSPIDGPEGLSR
jgi:hypothetical protein